MLPRPLVDQHPSVTNQLVKPASPFPPRLVYLDLSQKCVAIILCLVTVSHSINGCYTSVIWSRYGIWCFQISVGKSSLSACASYSIWDFTLFKYSCFWGICTFIFSSWLFLNLLCKWNMTKLLDFCKKMFVLKKWRFKQKLFGRKSFSQEKTMLLLKMAKSLLRHCSQSSFCTLWATNMAHCCFTQTDKRENQQEVSIPRVYHSPQCLVSVWLPFGICLSLLVFRWDQQLLEMGCSLLVCFWIGELWSQRVTGNSSRK